MTEKLGERCIDDGRCHHQCKDKCFRRECCEPLSGYKGEWKYDQPPAAQPVELTPYGEALERIAALEADLAAAQEQSKADAAYIAKMTNWRSEDRKELAAAQTEVERLTAANQMHREAAMQIAKDAEDEAAAVRAALERECADGDRLCEALGVSRTEGGSLNLPKMLAAIKAAVEKERNMWADVVSRNVSGDTLKKILDAFNQARGAAHE